MSPPSPRVCSFCAAPESLAGLLFEGASALLCAGCARSFAAQATRSPATGKPWAVIPARFASSRFPGKPLALLGGEPMIQHVWRRCLQSGAFARVLVATDDERIFDAVRHFGGEAILTSPYCASGTDRVAEVAQAHTAAEVLVNVQGDEPLLHPDMLRSVASAFEDPEVQMATLVRPLDEEERDNPHVVKALLARNGDALYFTRADAPFQRDKDGFPHRYGHIGLYGYRREVLLALAKLPPSPLEETEKLEQLRALECGFRIRCLLTLHRSVGVDTQEDLVRAEAMLRP